jgi:hypothetical protein
MKNWKKFTLLTALVTAAGYGFINRTHDNIPSDLRDAVADVGASGQLSVNSPMKDVPEPKVTAVAGVGAGDEKIMAAFGKLKADTGVSGDTPYEILTKLFKKASPAEAEDVTGWYYTLVARSPSKAFFGISGGILEEKTGSDHKVVPQLHQVYPTGFDLDTPVSAKMIDSLNAAVKDVPVRVKFPPGVWQRDMPEGRHQITYKKYNNFVIVKHAGIKIKGVKPPFDYPVFYSCYVKKI